eukprot:TRINITY_DN3211_c0_g1_i1.p1 TRINITY_DN3211_c0_g1~~TRINITY_DN3211_c0_g1_i1.p1  ORF type:complete len:454 (-),score=159.93 TRINITY_DN3211_c0_g1_i1:110-1471(-)
MSEENRFARALGSVDLASVRHLLDDFFSYISSKATLSRLDAMKLWRGLYFGFWNADKLDRQITLAQDIARRIQSLPKDKALVFLRAFWETMREFWTKIDHFRISKFMMLVRVLLYEAVVLGMRMRMEGKEEEGGWKRVGVFVSKWSLGSSPSDEKKEDGEKEKDIEEKPKLTRKKRVRGEKVKRDIERDDSCVGLPVGLLYHICDVMLPCVDTAFKHAYDGSIGKGVDMDRMRGDVDIEENTTIKEKFKSIASEASEYVHCILDLCSFLHTSASLENKKVIDLVKKNVFLPLVSQERDLPPGVDFVELQLVLQDSLFRLASSPQTAHPIAKMAYFVLSILESGMERRRIDFGRERELTSKVEFDEEENGVEEMEKEVLVQENQKEQDGKDDQSVRKSRKRSQKKTVEKEAELEVSSSQSDWSNTQDSVSDGLGAPIIDGVRRSLRKRRKPRDI